MKKDNHEDIFDEEFFEEINGPAHEKAEKQSFNKHFIFFGIVIVLFIFAVIRLLIWNKGIDSGYDPTEDTSEFDTEPLDYIQPLNSTQLENKPDDNITTIFCFGNSPFADNGQENALANEIAKQYDATVINASFADSLQAPSDADYSEDEDGLSLYPVVNALITKDFSVLEKAAKEVSEEATDKVSELKSVDISLADMVVIMYDINDYTELRPVFDPGNTSNPITFAGALESTIQLIQENYPYIRIVVLSIPASGKTIDNYYVDGDIHDLGNGTLVDYLGHEANICISNGVSFVDTYFGVINVDNRDKYIENDYHLNKAGAKAIVERMKKLIILNN